MIWLFVFKLDILSLVVSYFAYLTICLNNLNIIKYCYRSCNAEHI